VAILSPFAAVAAWFLNRRIVKPVQQVAEASVVLADGGEPMPIPTKAPQELSVMAESFNRMARKLRRAQDTEGDFLLSVGHELKTPLTAIDGYAELLADGAVDPKQAAEVLSLESARLRRLIGDLLDLARIDRSEFSVLDDSVDLADIARQLLERYQPAAGTLGIGLRLDAEPAPAQGDAGRLLQVASNLVENALRVTPSGGFVLVRVRPALLEVSDTGPGLSEQDVEHAFERFYLHRKYSGPEVGTGLGLAIVKELVGAMGGCIEVESQPGRGTTFSVELRQSEAIVLAVGQKDSATS
jgi:two-component system, OmpR family, sensor kinase